MNDIKLGSSWKVVQNKSHNNIYDIPIVSEGENEEDDEDNCVGENAHVQQEIDEDSISLHRDDVPAVELEANQLKESIAVDEQGTRTGTRTRTRTCMARHAIAFHWSRRRNKVRLKNASST